MDNPPIGFPLCYTIYYSYYKTWYLMHIVVMHTRKKCSHMHSCKMMSHIHTYLQCFSTLLLSAIFSPTSVHTGWVSAILAKSAFTALTLPPVDNDPMLTISTSLRDNFCTWIQDTCAVKRYP